MISEILLFDFWNKVLILNFVDLLCVMECKTGHGMDCGHVATYSTVATVASSQ